jgi:excisionase family DNA binding protein
MARRAHGPGLAPTGSPGEKLTLAEVCAELKIQRSTFYDWRAKGRAPRCLKLPNGELRITRRDLDAWLESCLVR